VISEWEKQQRMKTKPVETTCINCDGAGLQPDNNPSGVIVCKSCNGHGVVLFDGFHVHDYYPSKGARRVMSVIDEVTHDSKRIA
jgi:hypothetical protein